MQRMTAKQQGFGLVESLLVLVTIGVLIFGGWVFYQRMQDKKEVSTDVVPSLVSVTNGPGAEWNTYTNKKLGFTMKIPKAILSDNARCEGAVNTEGTKVYHPKSGSVSAGVVQDGTTMYIVPSEFYQGRNKLATPDSDGTPLYEGCDHMATTSAMLHDFVNDNKGQYSFVPFPVTVVAASSEADVKSYVGKTYDKTMPFESMKKNTKGDWYDVTLGCAGAGCGSVAMRYYPTQHKLIAVELGQTYKLLSPTDDSVFYDKEVADSVKPL